ncbi:golgin subfamily A member 6-like protein 25 [Ruditapes philippinarum]|uniref:golgin subfamily A member 6-like protein 25 n=1 Tax=Ruditapes philippinarum TaxID=129788 RepID=UPI00295B5D5D|nr:golgin subfamily A member 6-like protein 25 [Ruditapes philippinarum]
MGSLCCRENKDNAKRPTSPSQVTLADKTHERCLNKELMYKNEVEKLGKQVMDLEKLTKDKDKEITTLKENHYQQMEEEIQEHEYERKVLDKNISKQREQIRELREEYDTHLTRCLNKELMYKNEVEKLGKQVMDLEKLTKDKDKEITTLKENHYQQMEEEIQE